VGSQTAAGDLEIGGENLFTESLKQHAEYLP
jgi:hypothetical protein